MAVRAEIARWLLWGMGPYMVACGAVTPSSSSVPFCSAEMEQAVVLEQIWWLNTQPSPIYTTGISKTPVGVVLYNRSSQAVDLGWLSLNGLPRSNKKGKRFSEQTWLPAGSRLVLQAESLNLPQIEQSYAMQGSWYLSWHQASITLHLCDKVIDTVSYTKAQTQAMHRYYRKHQPTMLRLWRQEQQSLAAPGELADIMCMASAEQEQWCWQQGATFASMEEVRQRWASIKPMVVDAPATLLEQSNHLPWSGKLWLTEVLMDAKGADRGWEWLEIYVDGHWDRQDGVWLEQWHGKSKKPRCWWIEPAWLEGAREQFLWLIPGVEAGGLLACPSSHGTNSYPLGGRLFANGASTWRLRSQQGDLLDSWQVPAGRTGVAWQRCAGLSAADANLAKTSWSCHGDAKITFLGTPGLANTNCSQTGVNRANDTE